MKNSILPYLLLFLFSCNQSSESSTPECNVDVKVKQVYNMYLNRLKQSYSKQGKVLSTEEIEALTYLSIYTNLHNRANLGDVSTYKDFGEFRKDIKQWEVWYELNKCKLDRIKSDSTHLFIHNSFENLKKRINFDVGDF